MNICLFSEMGMHYVFIITALFPKDIKLYDIQYDLTYVKLMKNKPKYTQEKDGQETAQNVNSSCLWDKPIGKFFIPFKVHSFFLKLHF